MNAQKTRRLLTVLAGLATVSVTTAHAAGTSVPGKPAPTKGTAPTPAVTVKLGDAMLEEYHGDPANRTTTLRGGDVAQKTKSADSDKKHS